MEGIVYLDNNATTFMPPEVQAAMMEWCNRGNPSADYASAISTRAMFEDLRRLIGRIYNINTCCKDIRDEGDAVAATTDMYNVIFTSGASESNSMALSSIISAYETATRQRPHVVISAIEHASLLDLVRSYEEMGRIDVSYVNPSTSGHISPASVEAAITLRTCCVCVMHANNETGAINNTTEIGRIAHKYNVPYHCDTAMTFGKFPLDNSDIDSFTVSFHKLYGPPGVGALIIKHNLVTGWNLRPIIYGKQNDGLRGGTENVPGLGAAICALRHTNNNRTAKNISLGKIKEYLLNELSQHVPTCDYVNYASCREPFFIVFFSRGRAYVDTTIMISVVKKIGTMICNAKIKAALERRGVIISVGSACNTSSPKSSHVLVSMGADEYIRKGALRISICDTTTMVDINKFTREFISVLKLVAAGKK
jgi:cysteine desulfurase